MKAFYKCEFCGYTSEKNEEQCPACGKPSDEEIINGFAYKIHTSDKCVEWEAAPGASVYHMVKWAQKMAQKTGKIHKIIHNLRNIYVYPSGEYTGI